MNDYDGINQLEIEGGSRHSIYKVKWNNELFILKGFQLNEKGLDTFRKEIKLLKNLNHPNICEIDCYFIQGDIKTNDHRGFIQMPFYEGGQLDNWIKNNKP